MQDEICDIDPLWLAKWDLPVPRYTSYPTVPQFKDVDSSFLLSPLEALKHAKSPLSLYIHIPFCRSMCLFCACSVILNRNADRAQAYFESLLLEIDRIAFNLGLRQRVCQLHLGGGTPTSLTEQQLEQLIERLQSRFVFEPTAELSIEVDPRTVYEDQGQKLSFLRKLGFNRVSFGVQDLDPLVQKSIKRHQSETMTVDTFEKARACGFEGINLDLIYGLPYQTPERFQTTAQKILQLKPDRIAFYSYAKVPWLKAHQKAIQDETLPSTYDKFSIYTQTRKCFMEGGYRPIGMDHFSLEEDSLTKAYQEKRLTRNFQGYSIQFTENMIGLGVTAIGYIAGTFYQNVKDLAKYQNALSHGVLPVMKGLSLTEEDRRRQFVIQSLMCHFELDKHQFFEKFHVSFDAYFANEKKGIDELSREGFLEDKLSELKVTPLGRLFIRVVASLFDAYRIQGKYSKAI